MKPETKKWIDKADGDWKMAQREVQAIDPVWDGICFHAQQCAEKFLKAILEEHNIAFQKTHDLEALLNSSGGLLPELDALRPQLAHLSIFGIATRYPETQADKQAAEGAMRTAEEVRTIIRAKLGIP